MAHRLSKRDVATVTRVLDTHGRFDALVLVHPDYGHTALIRWLVKGKSAMFFESVPHNWPMFCHFVMDATPAELVDYVRGTYTGGWVITRNHLAGTCRQLRERTDAASGERWDG